MMKLRVERWHSSEASEEVHFFIEGTQTYVIGFNPNLIEEDAVRRFLVSERGNQPQEVRSVGENLEQLAKKYGADHK